MKRIYSLTIILLLASLAAQANNEVLVGSIDVNSMVSESGGAIVSIPIDVPAGIGGMQPNLSLVYNNQSGYGIAGWGWSLSGLSCITRTGSNQFYDGKVCGIQFSQEDNLMLDGQRLILQSGLNHLSGSTYRTAMESFNLVTCLSHSSGFSMQSKDGTVSLYGNDTNSCLGDDSNGNILSWYISEVTDLNGRKMSYSYLKSTNPNELYLQNINYTSTDYTSPFYSVSFIYMDAPHVHKSVLRYMNANPNVFSQSKLLERIVVKYQGNPLYSYLLIYDTSQPEPRLASIKKIDSNGNELKPVTLAWNTATEGSITNRVMSMTKKSDTVYGDFTGDGKTDILSYNPGNASAVLYRNTSSGTTVNYSPVAVNLGRNYTKLQTLDYNGDGRTDVVGVYQSGTRYYVSTTLSNGYGFDAAGNADATQSNTGLLCGDFDGDGRDEYIVTSNNTLYHQEQMLPVTLTGFNSFVGDFCITIDNFSTQLDFNGNGKTDILIATSNSLQVYELSENNGTTLSLIVSEPRSSLGGGILVPENFLFGDYNGDGSTDFIYCGADSNPSDSNVECRLFLSTTNSFVLERTDTIIGSLSDSDSSFFRSGDVNGDHLPDIVSITTSRNVVYVHRAINTGDSFVVTSVVCNGMPLNSIADAYLLDMTGNGMSDIVCFNGTSNIITKQIFNDNSHLLSSATDGFGNSHSFTYRPITDSSVCTYSQLPSYPYAQLHSPLCVVSGYLAPFTSRQYQYKNPMLHMQGKGFLGFDEITESDVIRNLKTIRTNSLQSYYIYMYPSREVVRTLDDEDISIVTYSYSTKRYNNDFRHIFIYPQKTVHEDCLSTLRDSTKQLYDDFGNVTSITKVTGEMEEMRFYSYSNVGSWCANKLSRQSGYNHYESETSPYRSIDYFYDTRGNLVREVTDSLSTLKLVHRYSYDTFGNCTGETVSGSGQTRTTSVSWSSDGRFPVASTDELGMVTAMVYNDTTGLLKSCTTAEGTTTYAYDSFGRQTRSTDPLGDVSTTSMEYVSGINGLKYSITETCTHQAPVTTWYNASGQPLYSMTIGFGNNKVFTAMKYNPDGSKELVSEPFFANSLSDAMSRTFTSQNATLYTYDEYGRTKTIRSPADSVTYSYNGLTSIVNSRASTTSTKLNASGLVEERTLYDGGLVPIPIPDEPIRSIPNHNKKITYTYESSGRVKTITPQGGGTITLSYDIHGNRTGMTDPDAGTISDSYNAFGQHTNHSQNIHGTGNVVTTYAYDTTNGRLLSETISGNENTSKQYAYHNSFKDKVTSITDQDGNHVSYSYDNKGRLIREERTFDGQTLADTYTYSNGHIASHGHVMNNVTKTLENFTYDGLGNMTRESLANNSANVWELLETNARGQILRERKGSIVTTYTYDDAGRILTICAPGIQDLTYTYDVSGNTLTKEDAIANHKAYYTYDGKNRLTSWRTESPYPHGLLNSGSSLRLPPPITDITHTITYDEETGNIVGKSDLGSNAVFTYNTTNKPHALQSVSDVATDWGNETQNITYTDLGMVESIEMGDDSYDIQYAADGRRIKSRLQKGDGSFTTRYYGNGLEKALSGIDNTDYLTYLCHGAIVVHHEGSGGALRAAPPTTPTAILQTYYDAQGSMVALADNSGNVIARFAYDPWGKRVNPTDWTQSATSTEPYHINRGYTMHEHLEDFGLINMNGRVFDPAVAQFLSPDNYIQSDGNWLNYNRYTYCLSNPLKYEDPSGEIVTEFLIGAAIGGVINVATHWNKISSFKDGLIAFGIGALAGGVGGLTGGVVFTATGGINGGFVSGAISSAISSAYSMPILNAGNYSYFHDSWMTPKQYALGILSGACFGGLINGLTSSINGGNFWKGAYTEEVIYSTPINECVVEDGDCINGAMKAHLPDVEESTWADLRQLSTKKDLGYPDIHDYPMNFHKKLGLSIKADAINSKYNFKGDFLNGLEGSRNVLFRLNAGNIHHAYALESVTKRTYLYGLFRNSSSYNFNVWNPVSGRYCNYWGINCFSAIYRF